jgi:RimP C-terminal SH3 domain
MLYKAMSLALVAALLHGSLAAQDQKLQPPRQTVAQMQQLLRQAQEKDKAVKVTLNNKIDNQKKFSGTVTDISDTGFTLSDQKTGKTMKFAYSEVKEVNRKGMTRGDKIATGVAIAGTFVLVMFLLTVLGITRDS